MSFAKLFFNPKTLLISVGIALLLTLVGVPFKCTPEDYIIEEPPLKGKIYIISFFGIPFYKSQFTTGEFEYSLPYYLLAFVLNWVIVYVVLSVFFMGPLKWR